MPRCVLCGTKAVLKCADCKISFYCQKQCQIEDWPRHQRECVKVQTASDLKAIKFIHRNRKYLDQAIVQHQLRSADKDRLLTVTMQVDENITRVEVVKIESELVVDDEAQRSHALRGWEIRMNFRPYGCHRVPIDDHHLVLEGKVIDKHWKQTLKNQLESQNKKLSVKKKTVEFAPEFCTELE